MENNTHTRRQFVKNIALTGMAAGLSQLPLSSFALDNVPIGKRVGIIGLDTSHSVVFTKLLNTAPAGDYNDYKVVVAYPQGSSTIESSFKRIPEYTAEVQKYGVSIVASIAELLTQVDVVMLETNDGSLHLEQAEQVIRAGKTLFVDKPVAATYEDVRRIYYLAGQSKVPVFSSSSLRYDPAVQFAASTLKNTIMGLQIYGPAYLEKTHSDLFWYGIHGVETLFTLMGPDCKQVSRVFTENTDVITGIWADGRVAVFRGLRDGSYYYGGNVFSRTQVTPLKINPIYEPLLYQIVNFFESGEAPFPSINTIEIYAFMEAANESKREGGKLIPLSGYMR